MLQPPIALARELKSGAEEPIGDNWANDLCCSVFTENRVGLPFRKKVGAEK